MTYRLHNWLVNLAAHPVRWPLASLTRRLPNAIRIPGLGVVINDVELAHEVLQRDSDFTKNGKGSIAAVLTPLLGPFALANMDGAEHRALRNKLGDLLSASRVHALLEACRSPLDEMAERLSAGYAVDLVRVMRTLSGRLAMEMMGVTPNDGSADQAAREIVALGERVASELRFRPLPERRRRAVQADIDRLTAYTRQAYDDVSCPETSVVGRLRALGLSFEETRGIVSIFFIAGTLTTALALPRIVALLIDSGQLARLRDCHDTISRAVDEGLRYVAPVPVTVRIAHRPVMLRGHKISAGTRLLVFTSNLTRDASVFPDPERFDIDRVFDARGRHLWYGAGPHFCFGFALAQRELHRVLETLAALPGRLTIQRRRPAFGALLARYERLDVRLERA